MKSRFGTSSDVTIRYVSFAGATKMVTPLSVTSQNARSVVNHDRPVLSVAVQDISLSRVERNTLCRGALPIR